MATNPNDPKNQKRIDRLQQGLYSRDGQDVTKANRPTFSQHIENVLMFLIAFVIRITYNEGCTCSVW